MVGAVVLEVVPELEPVPEAGVGGCPPISRF